MTDIYGAKSNEVTQFIYEMSAFTNFVRMSPHISVLCANAYRTQNRRFCDLIFYLARYSEYMLNISIIFIYTASYIRYLV